MRVQAALTERLPGAPVTRDQLTMLAARRQRRHLDRRGRDVPAPARPARRAAAPRGVVTRGLVYAEPGARAGRRGDHGRRRRPRRGAGPGRGVRRLPHRPARRRDAAAGACGSRSCSGTRAPGSSKEVGEGVTRVAPGDRVVIAWRAPCGDACRACRRGDPRRCSNNLRVRSRMHRAADGARARAGAALRRRIADRVDRARGVRGEDAGRAARSSRRACSRAASRPARAPRCGRRRCSRAARSP